MSIVVSAIFGYILALGVTFAIQDLGTTASAGGFAVKQVFLDSLGKKTAEVMLFITVGAQLYCGMSSITSASRMMYAFSRDGATPGHKLWRRLNHQRVPVYSVVAIAVLAFLCAFPAYFGTNGVVAYAAVTSIATIGLYIAYAIPIYLRLRLGSSWEPGEWNLGKQLQAGRDDRLYLGGVHLGAVHHADHARRDPVQERVHLGVGQLRADRRGRDLPARRRLVGDLGAQVVQGPDRAGLRGGARADRGHVRRGRRACRGACGVDSTATI